MLSSTQDEIQDEADISLDTFQVTVKLPHHPYKTQTIVATSDQAQDIRQSIIDVPHTFQYSCFHLELNGKRIPEFVDLGEISGIVADAEVTLVEDPYTEKDARLHVIRVRDLIGAAGDRTDLVRGVSSGLSLHDHVANPQENVSMTTCGGSNEARTNRSDTHAMSGFNLEEPSSIDILMPPPEKNPPRCIKTVFVSPWSPPPYHLRSKGHLLYLVVTTNEGEQFHITSHVTGFFVNKSSNNKFDPFPKTTPSLVHAHSLLTLLSRISVSFESQFKALQQFLGNRDPLSTFQISNALPSEPWVVPQSSTSLSAHSPDICRSQETYLVSGAENTDTLRDWNEEFQTTRELPRETVQDRVFRERVTSKLFADYNEAAAQGAILIVRGEVTPLNPTEPRDAQIFVYNNIFYSFGLDGVGTFADEGGDEAARVATGKDVSGVKMVNQLDIQDLSTPGTAIIDYVGRRIVAQSIVPGIFKQREPTEHQIDYGGVEGKDVIAENEAFVPLFKKLSEALRVKKHPVWDKDGKRHELEGSIETKGLLGTDGRKYVLDLYRVTPLDVLWLEQYCELEKDSESAKDNAKYPHTMATLRPELVDIYWRMKLREYIKSEVAKSNESGEASAEDRSKEIENGADHENGATKEETSTNGQVAKMSNGVKPQDDEAAEAKKALESDRVDVSGFQYALNPDIATGQQPVTEEDKGQWAKDEVEVRAASRYLTDEILPGLVADLQEGDIGFPMDGQSLSVMLHKRGINIRYLGKIAQMCEMPQPRLEALKELAIQEMVSRAFKHVVSQYLRNLPTPFSTSCIAHSLNCLLGFRLCSSPKAEADSEMRTLYGEEGFEFEKATPHSVHDSLKSQVYLRYRYELPLSWFDSIKPTQMLREVSLKLGLQMAAKDYQFTPASPSAPNGVSPDSDDSASLSVAGQPSKKGKKKKKPNAPNPQDSPTSDPRQTFHADDILNIVPVVGDSAPRSVLAEEALETGRLSIAQNNKELGQELLLESLSLHEQIYGILHAEVARVYYQLSSIFYGLGDKAIAVELARKAVIVFERTVGLDSNETILAYLNLGLFEHANNNTRLALTYIRHALSLWKLIYGSNHPDSITTLNNVAVMLQHLKMYHDSRIWFEASLHVCQKVSGEQSVNTATLLFQLAQALALDQDSKGAVARMREAYTIFNAELGPNDRNTKEAENWLDQLTQNAVSIAKHAKDVQARKMRRFHNFAPRVGMSTRQSARVGQQTATNGIVGGPLPMDETTVGMNGTSSRAVLDGQTGVRLDERSVEELLKYIEGGDAARGSSNSGSNRTAGPQNPRRRQQRRT
ncbi:MAG: Intracellular distribution of mitochondria [Alyxoria varia]|nr:MAG: Intracellular distribution of mitochondria [Alyxoria varia]